jgi:hypothetical protein
MLHSAPTATDTSETDDVAVDAIIQRGATGAVVVAAIATAIVVVIWFAFYLLVFVPRATAP